MLKPICVKLLLPGVVVLLVACGGAEASPAQEPVVAQEPPVAEAIQPALSNDMPRAEEAMDEEEITAEEPAPAVEVAADRDEVASEEVASTQRMRSAAQETQETASEEIPTTEDKAMMPAGETVTGQGPTEEQSELLAGLKVIGAPPELHNEVWLNSGPLKLADLRGKVVIVEFWTFG